MTRYIALLRGINVGGHRVKMERLRGLFGELGFCNVATYIQSGNVFFETDESDFDSLTRKIEVHLFEALGYEVPVFLRTPVQLEEALKSKAFQDVEVTADTRLMVVFTQEEVRFEDALPLCSPRKDIEIVGATSREIFLVLRLADGRMSDFSIFLRKALGRKVVTTSRFYDTTFKILEAAQNH